MIPIFSDPEEKRSHIEESFAKRFNHFEWVYLCSYRWFLKGLARAVETNDFSSLQNRAERALVGAHLRRSAKAFDDELTLCHSTGWYE